MRLALLLCAMLVGCDKPLEDKPPAEVTSTVTAQVQPPVVACPAVPPKAFTVEFNTATKHYRWCHGLYCNRHPTFDSEQGASNAASKQYEFEHTPYEKVYDPDADEGNWSRIKHPHASGCDKEKIT